MAEPAATAGPAKADAAPPPPGSPDVAVAWSSHHTPEGIPYFYNSITKASVWNRPADMPPPAPPAAPAGIPQAFTIPGMTVGPAASLGGGGMPLAAGPGQVLVQTQPQQQAHPNPAAGMGPGGFDRDSAMLRVQRIADAVTAAATNPADPQSATAWAVAGAAAGPGPPIQVGSNMQGPAFANLFIFHIPNELSNQGMFDMFTPFGNVISARIMIDRDSGRSRGFGFVSFSTAAEASLAIDMMNGFPILNKRLKVSHKKQRHGGGGGGGGGAGGRPRFSPQRQMAPGPSFHITTQPMMMQPSPYHSSPPMGPMVPGAVPMNMAPSMGGMMMHPMGQAGGGIYMHPGGGMVMGTPSQGPPPFTMLGPAAMPASMAVPVGATSTGVAASAPIGSAPLEPTQAAPPLSPPMGPADAGQQLAIGMSGLTIQPGVMPSSPTGLSPMATPQGFMVPSGMPAGQHAWTMLGGGPMSPGVRPLAGDQQGAGGPPRNLTISAPSDAAMMHAAMMALQTPPAADALATRAPSFGSAGSFTFRGGVVMLPRSPKVSLGSYSEAAQSVGEVEVPAPEREDEDEHPSSSGSSAASPAEEATEAQVA